MSIFDHDGNDEVEFNEFIAALVRLMLASVELACCAHLVAVGTQQSTFHSGTPEEKLRFVFRIYDIDGDGFISNGELFKVLKMMVGDNLSAPQLQQLVDKTILKADTDLDGKVSIRSFILSSFFFLFSFFFFFV